MTEEDIHINGKRVAMTERMMEEVLINELDNMLQITRESRLKLMKASCHIIESNFCSNTESPINCLYALLTFIV